MRQPHGTNQKYRPNAKNSECSKLCGARPRFVREQMEVNERVAIYGALAIAAIL